MDALHKILPTLYLLRGKRALGTLLNLKWWEMKQRIRVVSIIRKGDDILLMKRSQGRSEGPAWWELPTGKIQFGEQPEEAMTRSIFEYIGVDVQSLRLKDAVTFLAFAGSNELSNLYIVYEATIKDDVKIAPTERYSAYKYVKMGEINGLKLDEASLSVLELENGSAVTEGATPYREVANAATIYVDGSSHGNPGPSGIGYYIVGEDGQVIKRGGEFIGFATSRVAEYYALKEGCEQALELGLRSVRFVSDNLMMVNHMNGIYKVKNHDLMHIYDDIQNLLKNFEAVAFVHVKRELNTEADAEANLAVSRHFSRDVLE